MIRRLGVMIFVFGAAASAALATHPITAQTQHANLDDDERLESVGTAHAPARDHSSWTATVMVIDVCGGRDRRSDVASVTDRSHARVVRLTIDNADGVTRRREVFTWVAGAQSEVVRVARLDRRRGLLCPRLRTLFDYSPQALPPLQAMTRV